MIYFSIKRLQPPGFTPLAFPASRKCPSMSQKNPVRNKEKGQLRPIILSIVYVIAYAREFEPPAANDETPFLAEASASRTHGRHQRCRPPVLKIARSVLTGYENSLLYSILGALSRNSVLTGFD